MRPAIAGKDNPLIKEAASLRMVKYRRKTGLFMAEGEKMVREAVENGAAIVHIFATEPYLGEDPPYLKSIGDLVQPVNERVYQQLSGQKTPKGVSAVCRIPENRLDLAQCRRLMILDGVQDPGNVGTIHRVCDAAGFDGMACLS
jgi:TrmH family RNA methyltransferase